MLAPADGGGGSAAGYTLVGTVSSFRTNPDNTFTPLRTITAISDLYGVAFSFTILATTYLAEGGPALTTTKTSEVNALCGLPHVQDFTTEQDQGPSNALFNFAVVTVGTDDKLITEDVRIRMDQIATGGAVALIDAAWARLVALGAS